MYLQNLFEGHKVTRTAASMQPKERLILSGTCDLTECAGIPTRHP
jgi:hypothetical protein